MPELIFPLDEVLVLAEHATAAPSSTPPVVGESPGPALLLAAADGICLLSNGLPQLHAAPGEPHAYGIRAVYAHGYGPGTPPAVRDTATGVPGELLTAIPGPRPGPAPAARDHRQPRPVHPHPHHRPRRARRRPPPLRRHARRGSAAHPRLNPGHILPGAPDRGAHPSPAGDRPPFAPFTKSMSGNPTDPRRSSQ